MSVRIVRPKLNDPYHLLNFLITMRTLSSFFLILFLVSCSELPEGVDSTSPEQTAATSSRTSAEISSSYGEPGLTTTVSSYPVETAFDNLDAIVTGNPNLRVILRVDHSGNAAANGLGSSPDETARLRQPEPGYTPDAA